MEYKDLYHIMHQSMKNIKIYVASAFVVAAVCCNAAVPQIVFDKPATFFEETFVIGNGTQGAIIYGNTEKERISLNDITFWTGEPEKGVYSPEAYKAIPEIRKALDAGDFAEAEKLQRKVQGHYTQNYQPVGNLWINFQGKGEVSEYVRRLDLSEAIASVDYKKDGKKVSMRYLASAPDSVIAVEIKSELPLDFILNFDSQIKSAKTISDKNHIYAEGTAAYYSLPSYVRPNNPDSMKYADNRGISYMADISVMAPGAKVKALPEGKLQVKGARNATIYIAIATSFVSSDVDPASTGIAYKKRAMERIKAAEKKGFYMIGASHKEDYSRLFSRASVDFGESDPELAKLTTPERLIRYADTGAPDPDLEELYFDFGRYLLISCSRTDGVPANLQGLWNESMLPPWSSNYTVNINLEENYWPAEITNLSELHKPLLTFIKKLPVTGKETAQKYYGVDRGWCLGHNSDIWAVTNPVGLNSGSPSWANWNMGGAWLASHIWEHFLFTGDRDFLSEYYDTLKGAAEFCLGWMIKDGEGNLITSPSTSPENIFIAADGKKYATSAGGYADIAMIRECLADTRAAAMVLGKDEYLVKEIDNALASIAPYKIGAAGQLQEWAQDFKEAEPQHRHQSHLYGLFPGHHISIEETPELAAATKRTLEIKGDNTTGWSTGWRVNLLARLAEGEKAYSMYRRLLRYVSPDKYEGKDKRTGGGTYPNLLDAHSPFQIDGNFGGTAGVAEMLIQSTPESITLLPALPQQWNTGSFNGLRARGAFTLSADWKDGVVTNFTISSDNGGETTVKVNGKEVSVKLTTGETKEFRI